MFSERSALEAWLQVHCSHKQGRRERRWQASSLPPPRARTETLGRGKLASRKLSLRALRLPPPGTSDDKLTSPSDCVRMPTAERHQLSRALGGQGQCEGAPPPRGGARARHREAAAPGRELLIRPFLCRLARRQAVRSWLAQARPQRLRGSEARVAAAEATHMRVTARSPASRPGI